MSRLLTRILTNLRKESPWNFLAFCCITTLIYVLMFPMAEMLRVQGQPGIDSATHALWLNVILLCARLLPLIVLIAVNKYIFIVLMPVLTICTAFSVYTTWVTGQLFNPVFLDLLFNNPLSLAASQMTLGGWFFLIASILFSVLAVLYRWKMVKLQHGEIYMLVALVLVIKLETTGMRVFNHLHQHVPMSIRSEGYQYFFDTFIASHPERHDFLGKPQGGEDMMVVMVIGESLRGDHLGVNGYERNTTPFLSSDTAVVSFTNLQETGGMTHISVPILLTRAENEKDERFWSEHSFIQLFRQAGYYTHWLANQYPSNTTSELMHDAEKLEYVTQGPYVPDAAAMPQYRQMIKKAPERSLLIYHSFNNHHPYRYNRAVFTPTIDLEHETPGKDDVARVINTYDNSVINSDSIFQVMIQPLRDKNAIFFFCSDHGEELGENGVFQHAGKNRTDMPIGAFVWYSPEFARNHPEKVSALKQHRTLKMMNNVIFHSILDAASIHTPFLDTKLSVFR